MRSDRHDATPCWADRLATGNGEATKVLVEGLLQAPLDLLKGHKRDIEAQIQAHDEFPAGVECYVKGIASQSHNFPPARSSP